MEEPRKRSKKSKSRNKHDRDNINSAVTSPKHLSTDERRCVKAINSAEKHARRMAEIGLDINGEPLDNYSLQKYPVREWKLTLPGFHGHIALNPVVNTIGLVCLWSVVAWTACNAKGSMEQLTAWSDNITLGLSWLLQLSCALSFFLVLFLLVKYGHIHLGRPEQKPKFSLLTTAAMLLASATGPTLLIFGVAEPLYRARTNYYAQPSYNSQDKADLFVINMTVFRWGILTWTHIALVAVAMSVASHHFGLPLTFRSCFYPIFGAYTWGWIGDTIDGIALVSTVVGACATTGFASWQVVSCLLYLGWMRNTPAEIGMALILTILIITILSTASVISGLRGGVRFFSCVAFGLSSLLLLLITFLDDTKFLLNLQVQEVGYHLQTSIFQLNFWTDAFGQLRPGSGQALDTEASKGPWYGRHAVLLYAAISMCSVFGMLSAHLCRGRKVWQLVVLTLLVPILHALVWFCSWGGAALRQDRQATELQMLGTDYFNNSAHFLADGSQYCYDVPQEDVIVGNTTIFTNYLPKVTPVCQYDSTIPRANVLNVLNAFRVADFFGDAGAGPFFVVLFALACALNLIASSDSTSLMVDGLVSNARKNYHWLRRLFWAATIGILTTALIASGGPHFRDAIEALIVVSTVPMLFVMCLIVHPTFDLCRAANEHQSLAEVEYCVPKNQPEFAMPLYGGIFNVVEYTMSLGRVDAARVALGMDHATTFHVVECVKGLVVPFVSLHHVLRTTYPQNSKTNAVIVGGYALCYLAWFGVWAASLSGSYPDSGLNGIKWTFLAICGGTLGTVRSSFRRKYGLRSHIVADVMASFLLWPQVLTQMRMHCVLATNGLSTESLNDAVPASESSDQDDEFA